MVLFLDWYGHCQPSIRNSLHRWLVKSCGLWRATPQLVLRESVSLPFLLSPFLRFRFLGCGHCFLPMVDPLISGSTRFGLRTYDRGDEAKLKVDNNEAKSVTSPAVSSSTSLTSLLLTKINRNKLINVDCISAPSLVREIIEASQSIAR
jgi:hypothetical protein